MFLFFPAIFMLVGCISPTKDGWIEDEVLDVQWEIKSHLKYVEDGRIEKINPSSQTLAGYPADCDDVVYTAAVLLHKRGYLLSNMEMLLVSTPLGDHAILEIRQRDGLMVLLDQGRVWREGSPPPYRFKIFGRVGFDGSVKLVSKELAHQNTTMLFHHLVKRALEREGIPQVIAKQ